MSDDPIHAHIGRRLLELLAPPPAEPTPAPEPEPPAPPAEPDFEAEFKQRFEKEQTAEKDGELMRFKEFTTKQFDELKAISGSMAKTATQWRAEIDKRVGEAMTAAEAAGKSAAGIDSRLKAQKSPNVDEMVATAVGNAQATLGESLTANLTSTLQKAVRAYADRVIELKIGQLAGTIISSRGVFNRYQPGLVPISSNVATNVLHADGTWSDTAGGGGTVTSVSVVTANGISGSVATATTTPAITLTLGAITPSSVAASGTVTGSNLSGTNTGDQTITLTGDVTGSGTGSFAATLATVNANVGSFGSATKASTFTVNGKGLLTAAAEVTITPAIGSVTGLGANVATALAANVGSAGAFLAPAAAPTSGGIPYGSSSSATAWSAALASGELVRGGGAGNAPSTSGAATLSGSLAAAGKIAAGGQTLQSSINGYGYYSGAASTNTVFNGNPGDNANYIGVGGYWGIRTAVDNSFNVDVYNSGSPVTALTISQTGNLNIGRSSVQFGPADAAVATPQFTQVMSVVAGTSNVAGGLWTRRGSRGTGTGVGGDIVEMVAPAGSTGTSQNALTERFRIGAAGTVTVTGALTVTGGLFNLPQYTTGGAPTAVAGGMYFDTTLGKARVGSNVPAWETITSV